MKKSPNTERITVQLTPAEKRHLEAIASANARSTAAEALVRIRATYKDEGFSLDETPPKRGRRAA